MKMFWIRLAGLVLAVGVLFLYQSQAHMLKSVNSALGSKKGEIAQETVSHYKDGVYRGTGKGYNGDLTVELTVKGGRISSLRITDTGDDEAYLRTAAAVIDSIIDKQTTEGVDTITGATYSSKGIIQAAEEALSESRN